MNAKFNLRVRLTMIVGLMLLLAGPATWAKTYHTSVVFKTKGKFNSEDTKIVFAEDQIQIGIQKNAIKQYLSANNLNEVEIRVTLKEKAVKLTDLDGTARESYELDFTLGPKGCSFSPPLKLNVGKKYSDKGYSARLTTILGEDIQYNKRGNQLQISKFGQPKSFVPDANSAPIDIDDEELSWASSHSGSVKVKKGDGGIIEINEEAKVTIQPKSLDTYLEEQELDAVEITVEMYYGWDGTIWFVFGPSGAHFEPKLELILEGGYVADDMVLAGEDGELLEYTHITKSSRKKDKLIFYIPHFSEYYYDDYY